MHPLGSTHTYATNSLHAAAARPKIPLRQGLSSSAGRGTLLPVGELAPSLLSAVGEDVGELLAEAQEADNGEGLLPVVDESWVGT